MPKTLTMPLNILMLMLNDNAEHHDLALAFGVRDHMGEYLR